MIGINWLSVSLASHIITKEKITLKLSGVTKKNVLTPVCVSIMIKCIMKLIYQKYWWV